MATKETRKPFLLWKVKDTEYKLKLTAGEISRLETVYGCSLLKLVDDNMRLFIALDIIHGAMQKFHHGIDREDLNTIYDDYIDEGGSQLELIQDIILELFKVSGFFPKSIEKKMEKELKKAKKKLS